MKTFTDALLVASAVLTACCNAQSLVLPEPEGPYRVTMTEMELVDSARPEDPWNASHPRRLMISRFTPVPRDLCVRVCEVPYMSPVLTALEDEILAFYTGGLWPADVLGRFKLQLCCEGPRQPACGGASFPKILLGPGLNTTRQFYSYLAQQVASLGYEVVTMDHPYDTDVVEFPSGEVIFGGRIVVPEGNLTLLALGLAVRTADAVFVLDSLNVTADEKVVITGHSYGGAAAADALRPEVRDPRFAAGVNIDGGMWGPAPDTGVPMPFLTLGSEGHNSSSDASWVTFFASMEEKFPDVWNKELAVNGSAHSAYSDFGVLVDLAGLRDGNNEALVRALAGDVLGQRMMEIERAYLDAFFKFVLKGAGEGLLIGPSGDYPEVEFVR